MRRERDSPVFARRFVPIALIIALLSATIPSPALALSTQSEVQLGKETDKEITDSTTIVTDPLLNAWVNEISQKLWTQVARKDVPYNIKVLDVSDVNAFTTLGGYIYINEGTLDFSQSDDELAGVIAHETGHDERRHAITGNTKASIVNILFGIGSLFSPFLYRFGQIMQAGVLAKISRGQETEADKYGLMLMTRAGYDPDAMVSFMKHLGAAYADHDDLVSKYFADHPGVPDRVAHLVGYPELDPKNRTIDQRVVAALHNEATARYAIAAREFTAILKAEPHNAVAQFHLGQSQLALGQTSKGEQNLADAAAAGTPETRTLATARIRQLRESEKRLDLLKPNLQPLRDELADAQAKEAQAVTAIQSRHDSGRDQLKAISSRLQNLSYTVPDYSRVQVRKGGRLEAVLKNLNGMSRSIDTVQSHATEAILGVGSLEKNKEGGLLKETASIYTEMAAPLKLSPVPPQSLATLADYPRTIGTLQAADADMLRGVDAGRASLAMMDAGLGDLDVFLRTLSRVQYDISGEISIGDYTMLLPIMQKATDSLNKAAVAASQSSQLFNMARARQLQAHITLLGVQGSSDRYATMQRALNTRFHNDGLAFDEMLKGDLAPGDVAAATIVAADTNTTPAAIVQEAKATNKSIVDVANARGMHAEALEIFLGLIYLNYTDDPDKEARGIGA